jgi:antitoxin component YwqK of YwqJK toxin-antitoxin module
VKIITTTIILLVSLGSSLAQLNENSFLDSLRSYEYTEDYFSKYTEYTDSNYVDYLSSFTELDTFEIDSNAGFGFNPTNITVIYKKLDYVKFYTGLHVSWFNEQQISELAFYNFGSQKTALNWKFHPNGNLQSIIKYQPVLMDTITQFGKLVEPNGNYNIMQFYKTGDIELTGEYKKGEKYGSWIYFDKKGFMYKTETYIKGKRTSKLNF